MTRLRYWNWAAVALVLAPAACFNPADRPGNDTVDLGTGTEADASGSSPTEATQSGPGMTSGVPTTGSVDSTAAVTGDSTGDDSGDESPDDTSSGSTGDGPPALCEDGIVSPGEVCLGPIAMLPSPSADFLYSADLDGDGAIDLLSATDTEATVHLGDGTGGFAAQPTFATISSIGTGNMVVGDIDDNGTLDLLVNGSSSALRAFLGNGDGTFGAGTTTTLDDIVNAGGMALADFDGDGALDVFVLRSVGVNYAFGRGGGDGSFAFSPAGSIEDSGPLAWGDFDGDDALDVLVGQPGRDAVAFVRGGGDGTFTVSDIPLQVEVTGGRAASTDLNGDGIADAAFPRIASDDVLLFVGGAGGPSDPVELEAIGEPRSALFADLTNNGHDDLVTCGRGVLASISVWPADGTAELGEPEHFTASPCVQLAVGDFNGDGAGDVAYHSGSVDGLRVMLAQP